jgi:DNA-binding MarR family transcriptional regulator
MTTAIDTRLANGAWEELLTAHARLMRRFAAREYWDAASMREYDVLYTLSKCPGPLRLSDVSEYVLLSQPALSRLVDRLVERGFVERCADAMDARAVRLSLTEAGRDVQREIGRAHARDVAEALSALTTEELALLGALTRKLSRKES